MAWDKDIPADERKFFKITRFSPDTCGCVLEYAWDTRTPEETREHLPSNIVHACAAHEHHVKGGKKVVAHHKEVTGENRHKNEALAHLLDGLDPEHCHHHKDEQGNEFRTFKREPSFSFNDKRELVLHVDADLPAGHKKELADAIKKKCGGRKTHLI